MLMYIRKKNVFACVRFCAKGLIGISFLLLQACGHLTLSDLDRNYGVQVPKEFAETSGRVTYYNQIRPLLEKRCVVCHGCYDAPCQLKIDSYEGILRGANKEKVYNGTRLLGASLTRLFEDASSTAEWREKYFYTVLNERKQTRPINLGLGVMPQLLLLKQQHPLPSEGLLSNEFDFSLDRKQYCPRDDELSHFMEKNPLWGMPFGLPGLATKEHSLMMDWLAAGSPAGSPQKIPAQVQAQVDQWESFFNGDSLKSQLVNRYLYEHLFLAQLYFTQAPRLNFRLVRSSTPPGKPIERISRARPFDDPNVNRVYYRLWRDPSSIVAKTHMPYRLDSQRMQQWDKWFLQADYDVHELPSYRSEIASNPFAVFAGIPVEARYRFLLSEAQFTIMNFIKGPVCRGQVALNVIQDHFWVFFLDPSVQTSEFQSQFLQTSVDHLQLPAEEGNNFMPLAHWIKYSSMQEEYLREKAEYVAKVTTTKMPVQLEMIWNGDGVNQNAALTIFRHNDSASVHKGLLGREPKTAWVIGYPLMERIHYLLVAGFDVYGNVSHQLLTRLYMDFLRMEGEMTFVNFLPESAQRDQIESWYLHPTREQKKLLDIYLSEDMPNAIEYNSDNPKSELFKKLKLRLANVLPHKNDLDVSRLSKSTAAAFLRLKNMQGIHVQWLPQITFIDIPPLGVYSLIRNDAYTNLSSLFGEEQRRLPEADSLTFARGFIGAYPNSFIQVNEIDLPDFVNRLEKLASEGDYQLLRNRYGIRRTSPKFWRFSDYLHEHYRKNFPDEYGLLDYNRLENR